MAKKQYMEGKLKGCKSYLCKCSCCDDDQVEEWVNEYFAFHERVKDHLISQGIEIEFVDDRVRFKKCSDGKNCKFLKNSLNKDIDPRPIDCKIYPFVVDWKSIDFDNKVVNLWYWGDNPLCPFVKKRLLPYEFKKEAENIVKRDFAFLFYGTRFKVRFIDDIYKG